MHSEKRLSVVMTGRNDNYGGDFKTRLENCILSLFEQLNRYAISSEIIFVNYNPLPSPDIENFIHWPKSSELVQVKIITVPPEIHQQFVKENKVKDVPVNEYLGKNVGIRRAKGEYILAMNPDILFPDALWDEFLKNENENYYFRANRFDFQLKKNEVFKSIFDAKTRVSKVWLKGFSIAFKPRSISTLFWAKIKLFQFWTLAKYETIRFFNRFWKIKLHPKAENKYHCNVSGDFMLMHKKKWIGLNGYKEISNIALHIDALLVISAAVSGLKEFVMSTEIYHQEHERRYDATLENQEFISAYKAFQISAQEMIEKKKPLIYNSNKWGLAIFELPSVEK